MASQDFYRKLWSYAYYSICPIHRIPLRNACPHCKKPYSHLQPIAQRLVDAYLPIGACWSCGENVGNSAPPHTWGGDFLDHALSVQGELVSSIDQGAFIVPSYGAVYSRAYLDVMHCLADSLSMDRDATFRKQYVGKTMGLEFEQHRAKQKIFDKQDIEHLQAENRAILLCLTNWLMGDWPKRLLRYINKFDIDHNKLFGSIDKSYWLVTTATSLLQSQPNEFKSEEEIKNATILLRSRLIRPVSTGEVKEFVTLASSCGMSANEFCKTTLSIRNLNLKIIDRTPDESLLNTLADGTGVSIEWIKNTSLLTEVGYVFSPTGTGEFCWTIPPVTSNSKINKYTSGMAYCPACLHSDETPYYRKLWS